MRVDVVRVFERAECYLGQSKAREGTSLMKAIASEAAASLGRRVPVKPSLAGGSSRQRSGRAHKVVWHLRV